MAGAPDDVTGSAMFPRDGHSIGALLAGIPGDAVPGPAEDVCGESRAVEADRGSAGIVIAAAAGAAVVGAGTSPDARRTLTESSGNKLDELLAAENWWSPARHTLSWRQIVSGHRSVVINAGAAGNGRQLNGRLGPGGS